MAPIYEIDYTKLYNGLNIIKASSLEHLRDRDFVEMIICSIGLHNDPDRNFVYTGKYRKFMTEHGMLQQPRQLAEALIWLSDKNIRTYLEIGTFNGVCTGLIHGYLARFVPHFTTTTIDITERYYHHYVREMKKRYDTPLSSINFIIEDSNNVKGLGDDLVFIDGDHSYKQVVVDYNNVGKTAKYCMFHDICDSWQKNGNDGGSLTFWNEIKKDKKYYEFTYNPTDDKYFGIGILDQT